MRVDGLLGIVAFRRRVPAYRRLCSAHERNVAQPKYLIMALKGVCNVIDLINSEMVTEIVSASDATSLPDAARRALAEAAARRLAGRVKSEPRQREVNGRQGPEPVRYGDWENKGIASDF